MEQRIFYNTSSEEESRISKKETKDSSKTKKKKFNFNEKKKNTIKSLNEVEYFLNDFRRFKRYIHLYKFFK